MVHAFLFSSSILFICIYQSLFFHSLVNGHLGCYQIFPISDKAALKISGIYFYLSYINTKE